MVTQVELFIDRMICTHVDLDLIEFSPQVFPYPPVLSIETSVKST